ncbi:hypothetical protein GINT2_002050 [Glugoides intestinalis]
MIAKKIGSILNRAFCCSPPPNAQSRHRIDEVEIDSEISEAIKPKKSITEKKCDICSDKIEKNNLKEDLVSSKPCVSNKKPVYNVKKKMKEKSFVSTSMVKMRAAKKARDLSSIDQHKAVMDHVMTAYTKKHDIFRNQVRSLQNIPCENRKAQLKKAISCKEVDELLKMYDRNPGEASESTTNEDEAVNSKKNLKGAAPTSETTENEGHTSSEQKASGNGEKETGSVEEIETYLLKDSIETETQSVGSETEISCSIDFYDKKEFSKILLKTIKKNLKEHQETSLKKNTGG